MTRYLLLAAIFSLLAVSAEAQPDAAAQHLVRQQIAEACGKGGGTIQDSAVIEKDLTGNGRADLIISHEGITCSGGGRSSLCGAAVCAWTIYVRHRAALAVQKEMLGVNVSVGTGRVPPIHFADRNGETVTLRWNGHDFR